ncbi:MULTISPECIES: hypothetical protein [unclassified Streptomyces]|uniref:hypothetical protein n=1 Tax=unclassified Streptomyces TaxID=2593676 RepID=UPI0033AFBF97
MLCGLLATTVLTAATPAFADDDSTPGPGVGASSDWNFSSDAVCLQELAIVPVLGPTVADYAGNCSNGNVIGQTGDGLRTLTHP